MNQMNDAPLTKKSLGQHWLTDNSALQSIADAADITSSGTVLEIGPGPGALTKLLVRRAKQVVAVELDEALAADLPDRVGNPENLRIVSQDILRFDLTALPPDYKVVANIPYYLTSNLIRVLSESTNRARSAVLLVQKEVAERVAADPGDMSLLSVSAQYYWEVSLGLVVPARSFTPPPKVDSRVLVLHRREQKLFGDIDEKHFFRIVKAGYSQRRKTIVNTLSAGLQCSKMQAQAWCEVAGVAPGARAQMLSLEDWYHLYGAVEAP